jgi:hypothetical protein
MISPASVAVAMALRPISESGTAATLISAGLWLLFGLLIYFGYSAKSARKMRENLTKY